MPDSPLTAERLSKLKRLAEWLWYDYAEVEGKELADLVARAEAADAAERELAACRADVDKWRTTYDELAGVLQSVKRTLGGPKDEGVCWSAQRVVEERDRAYAWAAKVVQNQFGLNSVAPYSPLWGLVEVIAAGPQVAARGPADTGAA